MEDFSIDIVSDLHIDQWDPAYKIKYKCGEVKDNPLNWETLNIQNKILLFHLAHQDCFLQEFIQNVRILKEEL